MDSKNSDPQQTLLFLDLSEDNPIPEDDVIERLPPSSRRNILHITDYGARPSTRGQQWTHWRSWALAVDAMLADAQAKLERGRTPHYYVAGRVSLPLMAYLGLRRGKLGGLTVLNQRGTEWDIIPTGPVRRPGEAPFFQEPLVLRGDAPDGQVAVFLSTGFVTPEDAIKDYLERHRERHAATVVLETDPGARWLTADNAGVAAAQVEDLMANLRRYAPRARGAGLFLAGPAPLAVMAGRSINPNIFRPIWIPAFDANDYADAIRWPHGAVHGGSLRVLVFTASPANMSPIRVAEEEKKLRHHILAGTARGAKVQLNCVRGTTVDDILSGLNEFRPHVLHIASHGNKEGDLYFLNEVGDHAQVPVEGLVAAVKTCRHLQMIVLNACYSAAAADRLRTEVDCVIGIRKPVADVSGLEFVEGFYGALSHGRSVRDAHEQGLAQLALKVLPNRDDIELIVRRGCDGSDWVPLPGAAPVGD